MQGDVGLPGTVDDGIVGDRGNCGPPGPMGFNGKYVLSYWKACPLHPHNHQTSYDVAHSTNRTIDCKLIAEIYNDNGNRLPCYILDHVSNDAEVIQFCKELGASCSKYSDLTRILLGMQTVTRRSDTQKITNIFDRAIARGFRDKVVYLIAQETILPENIRSYSNDLVLQSFLQSKFLSHYLLTYSSIAPCLIDIIVAYIAWDDLCDSIHTH